MEIIITCLFICSIIFLNFFYFINKLLSAIHFRSLWNYSSVLIFVAYGSAIHNFGRVSHTKVLIFMSLDLYFSISILYVVANYIMTNNTWIYQNLSIVTLYFDFLLFLTNGNLFWWNSSLVLLLSLLHAGDPC